jgi:hypothetical protein
MIRTIGVGSGRFAITSETGTAQRKPETTRIAKAFLILRLHHARLDDVPAYRTKRKRVDQPLALCSLDRSGIHADTVILAKVGQKNGHVHGKNSIGIDLFQTTKVLGDGTGEQ